MKEDKRANHLDHLDEFMVWRQNFFKSIDEKIERNIEKLVSQLKAKKNEMNEQFEKPDDILVKFK